MRNTQMDWYCMKCHARLEQKFPDCPVCQGNHTVFYKPEKKEAPPPATLSIHVKETIGIKDTVGGSK